MNAKTATAKKPAKKAAAAKPNTESQPMKNDNAFLSMGMGVDALFNNATDPNEFEIMVNLDDIEIEAQDREEFENDEQGLAELGKSLRKHQIQAILLRPNRPGKVKPYLLVAGERRVRAGRVEGLAQLRARVKDMTDEEASDLQFAENVHRKNLTQIEEAKRIQRELDQCGGDVEAVLARHHKGRAWLSKILALLTLPEQAKRLVSENVSADLEVINSVKTIEKLDPAAAEKLVDDLKETRGKENAREKVQAVKDTVKPKKEKPAKDAGKGGGTVATPKDRSAEEPGPVEVFAPAKTKGDGKAAAEQPAGSVPALPPADVLEKAYSNIFEFGAEPKMVLETMTKEDRENCDDWLRSFYDLGIAGKEAGRTVIMGMRTGQFSTQGPGAFALAAYIAGVESTVFSLLNILGSVKP